MKKNTIKTILIILIIVLLGLVSFGGVYQKSLNSMKNVVKDYNYGMDFGKTLLIGLKIEEKDESSKETNEQNTEATANSETDKTDETAGKTDTTEPVENKENAEKKPIVRNDIESAKKKIENRLEALGVEEFYIRANYTDGSMIIELPEKTDSKFISDITAVGNFSIVDSDGNFVGGSENIKEVKYVLDRTSYAIPCVKIELVFKSDFVKNLVNNQTSYVSVIDDQGTVTDKKLELKIDESKIYTDTAVKMIDDIKLSNTLTLFLGQSDSTEEELKEYYNSAAILSTMIEDGKMPVTYKIDSSDIVKSNLDISSVVIVGIIILGIATVLAIFKYKSKGVLAILSLIGYIALMLLLIRYTNIIIAFEGVFALGIIFGIAYVFNLKFIANSEKTKEKMIKIYSKTLMQFINVFVVGFIISLVFSIQSWVPIKSFGTIMFWGIIIMIAYNYLITKNLIESTRNKK